MGTAYGTLWERGPGCFLTPLGTVWISLARSSEVDSVLVAALVEPDVSELLLTSDDGDGEASSTSFTVSIMSENMLSV